MRKKAIGVFKRYVICVLLLLAQQSVRSQVPVPTKWDDFVSVNTNPLVSDTFRLQTFAKQPADNWTYTSNKTVSVVETSHTDIGGKRGKYGLKIPMETEVAFQHYPLKPYGNVSISVHAGGKDRKKGDSLMIRAYRPGYPEYATIIKCNRDDEQCLFGTTRVSKNPPGIDLVTFKSASILTDSYYCIDSIYAYGDIPAYTLFGGDGNWNDTVRWSHLPAARHRNALINGNISVNTDIRCGHLFIGNGSVRILPSAKLSVNDLTLFPDEGLSGTPNDQLLLSSGAIEIRGSVSVEKGFAQKGKWYFISFPFDIGPEGIDPDFQLGDEQTATNGNYFYLKTYNGERRSSQASATGNWETIARASLNPGKPLFQKGKGYLIALDEAANRQTLRFTSNPHDIPSDFGKDGTSPITAAIHSMNGKNDHDGWYLCGNPVPSSLPISEIEPNEALDGFIYVYDGTGYQAYPIGSPYALPPFSAFFVKATKDTELSIRNISLSLKSQKLSTEAPLSSQSQEPLIVTLPDSQSSPPPFSFHLDGNRLRIAHMPSPGNLHIFDTSGSLVYTSAIPSGHSDTWLPLSRGVYILRVQTGQDQARHKFILP